MKNELQKSVKIDAELIKRMKKVKASLGIPMSEQIRRGMAAWLDSVERNDENDEV